MNQSINYHLSQTYSDVRAYICPYIMFAAYGMMCIHPVYMCKLYIYTLETADSSTVDSRLRFTKAVSVSLS